MAEKYCRNFSGISQPIDMDFDFDWTVVKKRRLQEAREPIEDWANESPSRRLKALEFLRRNHSGKEYVTGRIQRVHRITREARG